MQEAVVQRTFRPGHRYYQRLRAEHLAEEQLRARPAEPDDPPKREPTRAELDREASERLIERYGSLGRLEHATKVIPWLDDWRVLDSCGTAEERHDYLDRHIRRAQQNPAAHRAEITFLLIVLAPVRGSCVAAMKAASFTERPDLGAIPRHRREEAKMLGQIEHNTLEAAADAAILEALARYPDPRPDRFFPWLKDAIGHRLLNTLREELAGVNPIGIARAEHFAVCNAIDDALADRDAPAMKMASRRTQTLIGDAIRHAVPDTAARYAEYRVVKDICRRAVGRLSPRQQEVVTDVLLDGGDAGELARRRGISRSTVHNHASQARRRLHDDDAFFVELHRLRIVRDTARLAAVQARYPTGYLHDGQRRIPIVA